MNRYALQTTLRRRLPAPVKAGAKQVLAALDPLAGVAYRRRSGDDRPLPGRTLRARVGALGREAYVAGGRAVAGELDAALQATGRRLADFEAVLDFGCGPGRVVDGVAPLLAPGAVLVGTDVDRESIAWASRNRPGLRFEANGFAPPLAFGDAEFDLVYAISVFTHLTEAQGDAWLTELLRVLRPGGTAILTVLGTQAYWEVRAGHFIGVTDAMVEAAQGHGPDLEEEGLVFLPYARSGLQAKGSPDMDDVYGLTFHGETYLQERWGRQAEVVARLSRSINHVQDAVVLRKPA
ncbi:class I SAM-dependent methyltransferase [Conexibacter sp. SYSU D00693]|uniref:class I SAM-dependent methyltransferase n=1 Tax=Conexibacter sp. SYSU D00693 TaxID=2812560 RepID=UPI00196B34D7|nr:class I SAM-dependent methyltransferase [Conexibacter sp. SYSU D00693]